MNELNGGDDTYAELMYSELTPEETQERSIELMLLTEELIALLDSLDK
jgi:hypothetical protein